MTKDQVLVKRKADWLKQERRDFIDAYTEDWESDGWVAEWEAQEQELRARWIADHPDGTEDDWDEWASRQLTIWQAERREALREAEYERRWVEYVRENTGESLRSEG